MGMLQVVSHCIESCGFEVAGQIILGKSAMKANRPLLLAKTASWDLTLKLMLEDEARIRHRDLLKAIDLFQMAAVIM